MLPLSVIEDDNDHTMHYAQALPYAHLMDKEAENWLNEICINLVINVKARDFHGGVLVWVRRLLSYIEMKHAIPRQTRANLAKLLYELVTTPGMDTALTEVWAGTFMRLVKHRHRIGPSDLQLKWRPLYEVLDKKVFSVSIGRKLTPNETKQMGSVLALVRYAKRFFSEEAAKEIMEEFLPKYNVNSMADALKAQGYLLTFLPYEENAAHLEHCLPTIFSLWSMIPCSITTDNSMLHFVSRVAEFNLGRGTDIGLFSKRQVKYVFSVGLRIMCLPVGSRGDGISSTGSSAGSTTTGYGPTALKNDNKAGTALSFGRIDKFKSFARFIIYTLMPDDRNQKCSYTLSLLSEFIQASELYFHPSNFGPWSFMLTMFMRSLANEFSRRWRMEHEDDCTTPLERRLTPAIRREFVLILRPVAYLSMFGRDPYSISYTQSTLKYLSWLEPSLVLPGLLERIYPSLETLTETHRTSSALGILTDIALPLISREHYPAGGKHLLPLLHLTVPGIDMNDPNKTIQSFLFISTALMTVPMFDATQFNEDYYPIEDDIDDPSATLSRETEDYYLKITTGEFEEWLAKFLNRVFTIFENLPQESRKKKSASTAETRVSHVLLHACDIVFGQLSNELYDLALRLVSEFITDRVLPNATRVVGLLCDVLTNKNREKAAKRFIPICISNIRDELEHGASSTVSHADNSNIIQSDSTLHWYQNILYSIVSGLGSEVLTFKEDIVSVCQLMVAKCRSRRGIMWTGKLIRNVLSTVSNIYPTEYRSLKPDVWKDTEFMAKNAHSTWGRPGDPKTLDIRWHVPSEEEKDFALMFLDLFLTPSVTRLQEIMDSADLSTFDSYQLSNELCRHLAIVRNCVIGSAVFVAEDGETSIDRMAIDEQTSGHDMVDEIDDEITDDDDDDLGEPEPAAAHKQLEAGYTFTDPEDPRTQTALKTRHSIGILIHQLFTFFNDKRETDVESVKILIKIARTYLSDRGVEKAQYQQLKDAYNYAKKLVRNPFYNKHYPRNVLIRRAYNHHLLRLRQNTQGRIRTPLHDNILLDLLQFALLPYDEIRTVSRSALTASARCFRNAKTLFLPELLDALKPESSIDRIKGALHLLTHRSVQMACVRDWRFVPKFVKAICNTYDHDDAVVQELISAVSSGYIDNFSPISFRTIVSDDIDDVLITLLPTAIEDTEIQTKIDQISQKVESRVSQTSNSQSQLLDYLLTYLADPKIHWRYAEMASEFVEIFLRLDLKPTAELAAFANKCILSELPDMRNIGIYIATQVMQFIEQRTLAKGNEKLLITQDVPNPLEVEVQVNDTTNRALTTTLLQTVYSNVDSKNTSSTLFFDDPALGWYVWPKKYKAHRLNDRERLLSSYNIEAQEAFEEFQKQFNTTAYWSKLCSYLSQEIEKAEDRFNTGNARLFLEIFQVFGDSPLAVAKEHIKKLCEASDQKNSQRAAAEILAGLIRGMRHWNLQKTEAVWHWLRPLLEKVFKAITPDSLVYWDSFVRFMAHHRDPRRIQPLIDIILCETLDPSSDAAFNESRKLLLARALLTTLQWRAKPLFQQLLSTYINNLQHPYKQVREVIGSNMNVILQQEWAPAFGSVKNVLVANSATDGVGNAPTTLSEEQQARTESIISKLDSWLAEIKTDKAFVAGTSNYAHGSKTVLQWLYEASSHWNASGTLPYIRSMVPKLFEMQEVHDDRDLQIMASRVLSSISRINYPPSMISDMIDQLIAILTTSESWHMRIRALPVLQVFFFKHIFLLSSEHIVRIMETVGQLLMDNQIEVRQLASVTLGGLVRCSQRDAIKKLLAQFLAKIDIKLPKRTRDKATGKSIEPEGFAEAVLLKHSGVLGVSCLISAFPYEVPEWMPSTLCRLADCMAEPAAEIQATVRKTFSDFRRTHSDTWHEDMHKFTSDQLSVLSDMLISPSYYA